MSWHVINSAGRSKNTTGSGWNVLDSTGSVKTATTAGSSGFVTSGGRLTLTSATPVLTSDVSASGTVYYALYAHDQVPIYDGTNWTNTTFTELSNVLANSTVGNAGPAAGAADNNYDMFVWSNGGTMTLTRGPVWTNTTFTELSNVLANSTVGNAGPAAGAADNNYDMFVWSNGGTMTLTRGPVWTNDTTRSAGTALVRQNGIWLNNASITNGPAASRGTYVGTVRTISASATVSWELGGAALNGDPGFLYVWNAYNRIPVSLMVRDSTSSWTYATATWRSANASTSNRVSYVSGLDEEGFMSSYLGSIQKGAGANDQGRIGVGFDVTNDGSGIDGFHGSTDTDVTFVSTASGLFRSMGLGFHFIQSAEISIAGTTTFYGNTSSDQISGLVFSGRF